MNLAILNNDEALTIGADMWILPTATFSEWTKQLDWPLNLQVSKGIQYMMQKPGPELLAILQQNDMAFDSNSPEKKNLIIATQGLIPTGTVVIVPGESWETWSKAAVKVWTELGKPSVRFFLPTFAKWEKAKNSWPAAANVGIVQVVPAEGGA